MSAARAIRRRAGTGFVAYLLLVFASAGLLAYPLYVLLGAVGVAGIPFHRLTFRLLKLCALLGLWPLLAYCGSCDRAGWGFAARANPASHAGREWAHGALIGVVTLAAVAVLLLALGVRDLPPRGLPDSGTVVRLLMLSLVSASAVAVIEELWFRGALYSVFAAGWGAVWASTATAVLWSAVHFIRADVPLAEARIGWLSGYTVIAHSFGRFADPAILDSLGALFFAGLLLGLLRHRSGRIAACIGMHSGWVLVIRPLRKLTVVDPDAAGAFLVGGYDGVIGLLAGSFFALLAARWWWRARRAPDPLH